MKIDRALIIRRLRVPESMKYAEQCAASCEAHGLPYEYLDGIEFMSSEDAMTAVGVKLSPNQKRVSTGNNNCHASHIKAWRRILELDKACLILEHDVVVKGRCTDIDIIDMAVNVFGHRINHANNYHPIGPITHMVQIPQSIGGHAYAFTPNTAKWFVDEAELNGVNINVDQWINKDSKFPLYVADPTQVVCWPRDSTREWVDPDKKHVFMGHTTTFCSSLTKAYTRGLHPR